ncbi:MAG: hypothetical protein WCP89_00515 [archaeon]
MVKPDRNALKSRLITRIVGLEDVSELIIGLTNQYERAIARTPAMDFRAQKEIDKTYKELLAHLKRIKRYQIRYGRY